MQIEERLEKIVQVLDANKAEEIETFNLEGSDYMVEGVVVATALAARHLAALIDYLKTDLKPAEEFLHVDVSDEWIVADLGDMLIHVMTKDARAKYHLESFLQEFELKKSS
jgi:ribosome silencing factor RsfS/YbeB/iojap